MATFKFVEVYPPVVWVPAATRAFDQERRIVEGLREWHRADLRPPVYCRRCGGVMRPEAPIGDYLKSVCVSCREVWMVTGMQRVAAKARREKDE